MAATLTLVGPRKVRVSSEGVADFNRRWPCSELRASRAYWFEYDADGDLIDVDVPQQDDGGAATAMAADCKAWLFDGDAPAWAPDQPEPRELSEAEGAYYFALCAPSPYEAPALAPADLAALDSYEADAERMAAAVRESGYDPADWEDGTTEGADDDRDGA